MFANIIVDITHEKLDKIFQYKVPSRMEGELSIGMEVDNYEIVFILPTGREFVLYLKEIR